MKIVSQKVREGGRDDSLYFKLLRQDRLQMFQLYLGLSREVKLLQKSTDSQGASSIALLLAFEKWIGCCDFNELVQQSLSQAKLRLTEKSTDQTEIVSYILNPHGVRLSKSVLYRWMKVLRMPSSRELVVLSNAIKLMKQRGDTTETMEMNLLLCYPDCPQQLLRLVLNTFLS